MVVVGTASSQFMVLNDIKANDNMGEKRNSETFYSFGLKLSGSGLYSTRLFQLDASYENKVPLRTSKNIGVGFHARRDEGNQTAVTI